LLGADSIALTWIFATTSAGDVDRGPIPIGNERITVDMDDKLNTLYQRGRGSLNYLEAAL